MGFLCLYLSGGSRSNVEVVEKIIGERRRKKREGGGGVLETKIHKQDRERRREGLLVRDNNHGADTTYCVLSS